MTFWARPSWTCGLLAAAVFLLLAQPAITYAQESDTQELLPDGAAADTPAEPQEPAAIAEERELQLVLEEVEAKHDVLLSEVRKARGDELEVLNRQLADLRLEYLRVISELVDNLLRQESEDLDATALRNQLEQQLSTTMVQIGSYLRGAERRVTGLRRNREEATEEELLEIERAIAKEVEWAIVLYRGMTDTVDDMQALGMDASKFRKDLTQDVLRAAEGVSARLTFEIEQQRQAQLSDPQDSQAILAALELRRATSTESLAVVIRLLQRLEQPATKYQKVLLAATGEVTADVFDRAVAEDLLDDAVDTGRDWVEQNATNYTFRFVLFVVIVALARLFGSLIRRVLRRTLASDRVNTTRLLREMVASVIGNTVFLGGILFGLNQMGIELGPVLAGLGIAGFIVGFALQDVLGNFASGVILLSIRPYDVGDMIEAAGVFGEVSQMSLVATTILTIDHQTLVVPNSRIWGDVIKNVTFEETRRIDMVFRASYSDDVDHVLRVCAGILEAHEHVLTDPPPILKLHKLGEDSMEFVVRPWVKTENYWETYWDVTREVKRRFDEEGIQIPVPQREVRMVSSGLGETD